MNKDISVLLVEDHAMTRLGLGIVLEQAKGLKLIAEAEDGLTAVEKAKEFKPDVILMDIGLPNIDGIEATRRIKEFNPDAKILIFTSREEEKDVFDSFASGANGYIMKGTHPEQMVNAIKANKKDTVMPTIEEIKKEIIESEISPKDLRIVLDIINKYAK